jgi:hypothetical protein
MWLHRAEIGHRVGSDRRTARPRNAALKSVLAGALLVSVAPVAATTASADQPSQVAAWTASMAPTVSMLQRWPVLSQGPNRLWPRVTVRSLQYLLRARGARIAVDGVFGPHTKAAVVAFQRSRHLVVNGVAEAQTWTSLIITLSRGSRGDAVRAVQDQANFRNLKNGHSLNVDRGLRAADPRLGDQLPEGPGLP